MNDLSRNIWLIDTAPGPLAGPLRGADVVTWVSAFVFTPSVGRGPSTCTIYDGRTNPGDATPLIFTFQAQVDASLNLVMPLSLVFDTPKPFIGLGVVLGGPGVLSIFTVEESEYRRMFPRRV